MDPAGVTGEIVFNETHQKFVGCKADNTWQALHGDTGVYVPNAVEFIDAEGDYLQNNSLFSGATDSKQITGSFWVYRNPSSNTAHRYLSLGNDASSQNLLTIRKESGDAFNVEARDSGGTKILDIESTSNIELGQWHHIVFSLDLSNPSNRHIYIDGNAETIVVDTYLDEFVELSAADRNAFGQSFMGAAERIDSYIADFWIDFGTYIDLSVEASRRKFIDANGNPVFLGADGSLPTGAAPDIFLSGDTANWHNNKGTGGGFTENGTLTTASTTPGSSSAPATLTNGLIAHWSLEESSGNVIDNTSSLVGTPSGTITYAQPGVVGNAIDCGGVDGSIALPNLPVENSDLTLSIWLNSRDLSSDETTLFSRDITWWLFRVETDAGLRFGSGGGVARASGPLMTENTWHHIVAVYDDTAGSGTLYVDGAVITNDLEDTGPSGGLSDDAAGGPLYLCGRAGGSWDFTDGLIDEARIYNRALNATEVQSLYEYELGFDCFNPDRDIGEIIFNSSEGVFQGCTAGGWIALHETGGGGGSDPCNPANAPAPGQACDDGSVYAGLSPDGSIPMYTTPADAPKGRAFADSAVSGYHLDVAALANCTDGPPGTSPTCRTGESNTAILVAEDSKTLAGFQEHQMAAYCNDLDVHQRQDWYLPAQDEMHVLYQKRIAIGGFSNTGWFLDDGYMTSSEASSFQGRTIRFHEGGAGGSDGEIDPYSYRCVRKGYIAPAACQNPTGATGEIIYNASEDVY